MIVLTNSDIVAAANQASKFIPNGSRLFGVPRGGVPVAYLLAGMTNSTIVDSPEQATVVVDDIIDSGTTREKYKGFPFVALYGREKREGSAVGRLSEDWLVFPWEGNELQSAEDIGIRLLQFIGEDPNREGLQETPARFIKAWKEWTSGYQTDISSLFKDFGDGAESYDQLVMVDPIQFHSHCEHHLAAIFGTAHIAYIPNGRIAGLSKFVRVVDAFANRLQVQERLTTQIADTIDKALEPLGVAILIRARHFCMESRGVKRPGTATTTVALKGVFKNDAKARAEFMGLVK